MLLRLLPAFALMAVMYGVDFNREIRPILSDNCFQCHGPDEKHRMAGLRLDTRDGAFTTSRRGAIIVPGDASKSLLYQRISHADTARRMPPASAERTLTARQVETVKQWIDGGAKWETHWAFTTIQRPDPPKNAVASRNPIDRFVLARLESEGLRPSPEADRATLLRRLSFDVAGLPPTVGEVAAFAADKSADAYEKQVDRLLASPAYGERMAMQWLDVARYADSHGYHIDSHRDMWPWRDWLIRAFNANMPFDRFTILQLAGDLLPNTSQSDRIASGFNRNHMINFEGGAIPEEYQVEYVVDRVDATATTWMGLTMGCARCHSHKYDPISQKEFYQFYAFFNHVSEKGLDGREGNAKPELQLPTPEQLQRQKELAALIQSTDDALHAAAVTDAQAAWQRSLTAKPAAINHTGLAGHYEFDASLSDSSGNYRNGRTLEGDPGFGSGRIAKAVSFDGQTTIALPAPDGWRQPATLAVWLNYGGAKQPMPVFENIGEGRRGFEVWYDEPVLVGIQRRAAHLVFRFSAHYPDNTCEVRSRSRFAQSDWTHITLTTDGSRKAAGLKLYVNGKPEEFDVVRDTLTGDSAHEGDLLIGNAEPDAKRFSGSIDDLRFYARALAPEEIEDIAVHHPVRAILSGIGGKLTKPEEVRLRDYYLRLVAPDEVRKLYADLARYRQQSEKLEKEILTTMVMDEMEKPRDTFVLARGDYRNPTEKVSAAVPAILPPLPNGAKADRLALARWLVDPSHPLTARVEVNRLWQMFFGLGLVKTAENFGSQGEPPSHRELLDWLAAELIDSHWDVKHVQRLILTSATYRQSSKVTGDLLEKDPENRLLARGPRFRLPAETVRDNALAVSGLLNRKVGGPSVFPYQPPGIWEELAFGDGFSMQTYVQSHGPDLYRRSMYTFWKRSAPPAQMLTFDAPDREKCTARRLVTNTPLQALVLLNDPTYIEASRMLAARALRDGGDHAARFIFEQATERAPEKRELALLEKLYQSELRTYQRDPEAARKLLGVGESPADPKLNPAELAAWTTVASAVLNLDETITKE